MIQRTWARTTATLAALALATGVSAQTLTVTYPESQNTSPRMSALHGAPFVNGPTVIHHPMVPPQANQPQGPDGAAQLSAGSLVSATLGASFDGMSVYQGGYIPSDNNIAVGPNHIVEVVNAAYAVYSKTGTTLLAPVPLKNLWTALTGSACAANNGGDPVVLYDRLADRWMVTQLGSLSGPYSQCIAVSMTNDPTGAFYLYAYSFGSNLNDYPKFGVWPTATNAAYLATYNLFANGASFVGAEICAYDRTAMLAGQANPAALCYTGISGGSFLPADLDGATPPVDGTPAYFVDLYGSALGVYKLAPNFANSTATLSGFSTIPVASYTQAASSPQPGTARTLDALSDRLMFRLAFRMFADHESMVVNHSVVGTSGGSGVRWYELRSPVSSSGSFSLYQQSTFTPDTNYRWMGSAAMDQAGDIALGYSVSNATSTYPSIRYTARFPSDPLGTMQSEATLFAGSGSQTGYSRWGDYSSLRIDPADDCTFWYVNEYLPVTSSYGWYTRIGSFQLSNCSANPDFALAAAPATSTVNAGNPAGSTISVSPLNGYSGTVALAVASGCPAGAACSVNPLSVSGGSGSATLTVATAPNTPAGTYTVTVSGADGALQHTATFTVTVNVPDFTIAASPTSLAINQGDTKSSTISVTGLNGFTSPVSLNTGSCPTSATCSFSTSTVNPGATSLLSITPGSATGPGSYTVTVTGTGLTGLSHTTSLSVTVGVPFTMPSPISLTVTRGSSNTVPINVGLVNGTSTPVTLSISSLPKGVSASFTPNPVNSGSSSTLKITANRSATAKVSNLTITGTNGISTQTTPLTLTVR